MYDIELALRFLVPYSACDGDEFRKEAFRCE